MWVKIVVIGYASAVALANFGLVAWAWRWGQITAKLQGMERGVESQPGVAIWPHETEWVSG